ncbi:hypothetical protein [Bdellovibrio bacteriovorus]|uniref:Uncharacterized protein n=1 Tax=Bdellovibrio bacteriovorus TaxID=959 RepID=A0A150WG41_BDEBC|nr:hypothetical protein [Bdellovibrio bacteriovorus]KYG61771.1 hypothetical protein AZI85_05995 [Bdellovibrio bacteriovorus]KYG67924.1 hypothetical protein AZI87_01220 [Bdellovibrio bacteriovorus]
MHRTKILRALISVSLFTAGTPVAAAKVDVFSEFNKKVAALETELKKEKDVNKRFDAFLKSYKDLSDLRAKNPRQSEEKELNMSLFMESLSYMPDKKEFQAKKCPEYKKEVTSMMKSYDKSQKEAYVDKAFQVVDLICK